MHRTIPPGRSRVPAGNGECDFVFVGDVPMWECVECGTAFDVPIVRDDGVEICPCCDSEFIEEMGGAE